MIFKKKSQPSPLQKAQLEYSRELFVMHSKFLAECQMPGANKTKLLRVYDARWRKKCYTAKKLRKLDISLEAFIRIASNEKINDEMLDKLSKPANIIMPKLSIWDRLKLFFK